MRYAGCVIDNKSRFTDELYTYGCDIDGVRKGSKVRVSFGRGKGLKDAYVFEISDEPKGEYENLKNIEELDDSVSLPEEAVDLARWMHDRYLCRYMDAVRLFLPVGKPLKSGKERDPISAMEGEAQPIEDLTEDQKKALSAIDGAIDDGRQEIFLLHGVTGSGKTEVYMQAIAHVLTKGKNAVMLVPEISLTEQIISRFVGRFGAENLAVMHSGLSQGERYDQWQRIRRGDVRIVIGARSAIFAPLADIGLVVMDEEHESTYKSDMSPKYDTLELAIKRTKGAGGSVLLGSATPSVVSYERAERGIYKKLALPQRYNKVALPKVTVTDLRDELAKGNLTVIGHDLHEAMAETLEKGEQVILFMNRRGYETFVSCRACGHVMECPKCGISLTYHRRQNALVCHYCDYKEPMRKECPKCGRPHLKGFGTGTEKVVETVEELFPGHPAARLDLDATKRKGELSRILKDFGSGKTEILIGTQLVAKGLDYRNVGLVGVVSCDVLLNIPDYRAPERAFQLITQAAGRAGRGEEQGRVIIQTYTPEHYAVTAAAAQDYEAFYREEVQRRKRFGYPPFTDLIQVVFSAKTEEKALGTARAWRDLLAEKGAPREAMIVPEERFYDRDEPEHKACLLIRAGSGERAAYLKHLTLLKAGAKNEREEYSVVVDVNPYSLWRI